MVESPVTSYVRGQGGGEVVDLTDPSTGEHVVSLQWCTPEEATARLDDLADGWQVWRDVPLGRRAEILTRCGDRIMEAQEELAGLLTLEQGKPLKEARIEVRRCADTFFLYGRPDLDWGEEVKPLENKLAYTVVRPLGVVAAIVPWNFPLTLLANKLVPALMAGNGVAVKPAPTTPLATSRLLDILVESGVTESAIAVFLGDAEVGEALVTHPAVRKISLTGSTATGRAIMSVAADGLKRLTLELGGSDPLLVCADADLVGAARAAAVGRFFNCGQACIAVKRVLVERSVADEFLELLVGRVAKLTVGDGRDAATIVGPLHSDAQLKLTLSQVEDAVQRGAKLAYGGKRLTGEPYDGGHFMEPTILVDVPPDARILTEECFGPALPVITFDDLDEGIALANESDFGLGSAIWTSDREKADRAIARLDAGNTWVNDIATDHDIMPFGGVKASGFGKERGTEVLREYVTLKSVVFGDPNGL